MEDTSSQRIKLTSVKVIFANLVDEGFGKSITIDATDPQIQKEISDWVKTNNIGKGAAAGNANFKEYEKEGNKTVQYSFKINDYTKFAGLSGLDESNLGYGSTVSLVAQAFDYDNKFGKGTSASLSAVLIEKGTTTSADGDLAELLSGHEGQSKDVIVTDLEDKPIDLSSIPF